MDGASGGGGNGTAAVDPRPGPARGVRVLVGPHPEAAATLRSEYEACRERRRTVFGDPYRRLWLVVPLEIVILGIAIARGQWTLLALSFLVPAAVLLPLFAARKLSLRGITTPGREWRGRAAWLHPDQATLSFDDGPGFGLRHWHWLGFTRVVVVVGAEGFDLESGSRRHERLRAPWTDISQIDLVTGDKWEQGTLVELDDGGRIWLSIRSFERFAAALERLGADVRRLDAA